MWVKYKVFLFVLFLIPLVFTFFQTQIISHELYHFIKHSPQSTAICIDRDLRTNIVAYTIREVDGQEYYNPKTLGSPILDDTDEEFWAEFIGYTSAFLVVTIIGIMFIVGIERFESHNKKKVEKRIDEILRKL